MTVTVHEAAFCVAVICVATADVAVTAAVVVIAAVDVVVGFLVQVSLFLFFC